MEDRRMKHLIGITSESFIPNEAMLITHALDAGIERMHLRKPHATTEQMEKLIRTIPQDYHARLVLNDCHTLAVQYGVGGIHLNARHSKPPAGWQGNVSRSCHSLEEVMRYKEECNYLFLSPIFDSISKAGYTSHFTEEQLLEASQRGIIDERVIALGGISIDNIASLRNYHFGGVAFLGSLWSYPDATTIETTVRKLKEKIRCYNL